MSQELKPCESCSAPKHQQYPQRNGDSICAACGATYGVATAPVPPAGEWEKLAKHLAYYLPSALVSHQHMMTPETLSDALEALDKVRNMPALPAVSGVGRMPERLTSDDDRVPNMHSLQKVAWCSGYGRAIDACTPIVTRLQAEIAALQQRLNTADQRVDELQKDKERLDALDANYWDVRHHSSALGDTGDYTSCVEIVGHWMDKPNERVIGENYNENLRAAIDQAMKTDAYPPARPEYPELDAALAEEDWHMNPCKQGHRDVGACQGKAFCHTCDETITAETTQQAFEQWNATHPAVPQ